MRLRKLSDEARLAVLEEGLKWFDECENCAGVGEVDGCTCAKCNGLGVLNTANRIQDVDTLRRLCNNVGIPHVNTPGNKTSYDALFSVIEWVLQVGMKRFEKCPSCLGSGINVGCKWCANKGIVKESI